MFSSPTFLGREQAAKVLTAEGIKTTGQSLADKASDGTGPRYTIINGRALYKREWLLAWVEEQAAKPVRRRQASTRKAP